MPGRRLIVLTIALAACNYDWTYRPDAGTPSSSQKDAGDDPNVDPGPGTKTPCSASKTCPTGQYCRFNDGICGTSPNDAEGVCLEAGLDCKTEQVCTCKGTFDDACNAQKAGIDVDVKGLACANAKDTFVCGKTTCVSSKQFCLSKAGGEPQCADFTGGCFECKCTGYESAPSCSCNDAVPGQVQITCK